MLRCFFFHWLCRYLQDIFASERHSIRLHAALLHGIRKSRHPFSRRRRISRLPAGFFNGHANSPQRRLP